MAKLTIEEKAQGFDKMILLLKHYLPANALTTEGRTYTEDQLRQVAIRSYNLRTEDKEVRLTSEWDTWFKNYIKGL